MERRPPDHDPTLKLRRMVAVPLAGLALVAGRTPAQTPLDREGDPVVVTGQALPALLGVPPGRIVGFRWSGSWEQVPVQVDEMAVVDFGTIYGSDPIGQTVLTYTDEGTFTGPDPEAGFDADDELVFMARHSGPRWTGGAPPPHTVAGSGVELLVTDPLDGAEAFLYLFLSDGSLDPGAGQQLVSYRFVLLSGDYKSTYKTAAGPNPEDSRATSPAYEVHFADRWIRDETRVREGGATGVDILDRHKNLFAPGTCGRSEDTFSNGEGAFIVNRSGPVRALRGYVGANSGVTTHRIHRFYEAREDVLTRLRVHPIVGAMDYFDYAPAASGMRYRNDLNPDGATVDGVQDDIVPGEVAWEMLTGAQGTLAMSHLLTTDIPDFSYTWYYSDRTEPEVVQCTGDAFEYGASGFWRDGPIPNTNPSRDPYYVLETTRVIRYAGPNQTVGFAERSDLEARNPLSVVATPLPAGECPDSDGDGYAACDATCSPQQGVPCGDCDDASATIHPGQPDSCNGLDDDCDPATADGSAEPWHGEPCDGPDADGCAEGTFSCSDAARTCSDLTADTPELCGNGLDDDCDGRADEEPDRDGDSLSDCLDNCPQVPNPDQADFDRDGAGDACEAGSALADADRSGRVDGFDLARLARAFGSACAAARYDPTVDLTRDCLVDGDDVALLAAEFGRSVPP